MSQKQQKLKVIIHAFRLSRCPSSECHELPPSANGRSLEKESCDLKQMYGWLYVHFKVILGFTRNEQTRCLKSFPGNTNGDNHPHNITSHATFLGMFQ